MVSVTFSDFSIRPACDPESTGPIVVLSAHLDTVFPAGTPLHPTRVQNDGVDRLEAPGASDNGAGVAGMLAIVHALVHAMVDVPVPLLFLGNVGEEGEGDLRGVRHLYGQGALAGRIAAHIVLDGAGADSAVTQALGSRRFQSHDLGTRRTQLHRCGHAQPDRRPGSGPGHAGQNSAARRTADHSEPGHDSWRHERQFHP